MERKDYFFPSGWLFSSEDVELEIRQVFFLVMKARERGVFSRMRRPPERIKEAFIPPLSTTPLSSPALSFLSPFPSFFLSVFLFSTLHFAPVSAHHICVCRLRGK